MHPNQHNHQIAYNCSALSVVHDPEARQVPFDMSAAEQVLDKKASESKWVAF